MTSIVDLLKEQMDKAYRTYESIRDQYDAKRIEMYVSKWKNKFIVFRQTPSDIPKYMFVYNIWCSGDELLFEGFSFSGMISEYVDSTYFTLNQFGQDRFRLDYFDEHGNSPLDKENKPLMSEITKETFLLNFNNLISEITTDTNEFDFTKTE